MTNRERKWERFVTDDDNVFAHKQSEEVAELKKIKNRILKVIMILCFSKQQNKIYKLNTQEGKSIKEISVLLSITESTVRVHLKNCKDKIEKFAELLEQEV